MIPGEYLKYELKPFIKKYKSIVILMVFSILVTFALITLVIPLLYSNFSSIIKKLPIKSSLGINFSSMQNYFFIFFVVFSLYLFFAKIRNYIETKITYLYPIYTRKLFIKKIVDKYRINFKDQNIGLLIPKILEITYQGERVMETGIQILQNSIGLLFILFGTTFLNYKVGFTFFIYLIGFYILSFYRYKYTMPYSVNATKKFYKSADDLGDDFTNLLNTYINNKESDLIKKQNKVLDTYLKYGYKEGRAQGRCLNLLLWWQCFFFIVFFYINLKLYKQKVLNSKTLLSLLLLIIYSLTMTYDINNSFWYFIYSISPLIESDKFIKNIFGNKNKDGKYKGELQGSIQVNNINFKYDGTDHYIIKNLSFSVKKGERLGIIGRSGSGKSTIMKILVRLYKINSGKILIDNIDIEDVNINHLRKNMVYVNQNTQMYNNTILYNIQYGNNKDKNYIEKLIKKYNITVFDSLKNGIYSNVGTSGGEISLGMQKVIVVLRGILRQSKIIIFDEPLSSLDKKNREKILNLIKEECKNQTVIIITHDMEIIPYCTKVINFNKINKKNKKV